MRTGIADHNAELLPELGRLAPVACVVPDDLRDTVVQPDHVDLLSTTEFKHRAAAGSEVDFSIYHMGNHYASHHWVYTELLRAPGLAVLHDASLLDFYRACLGTEGPALTEELRFNYGSLPDGVRPYERGLLQDLDRMALTLVRRVAESSVGIVAHSEWAAREVARRFPHKPAFHIPLGVPLVPEDPTGTSLRRRLGWGPDNVVFALLGGIWPHKRLDLPIRIFAAVHQHSPAARLLIAGRNESPETVESITRLLRDLQLGDDARLLTELPDDDFSAALLASDVLVDLRTPTAGEMPATVMRAFGCARPVLTTDLPQLRDLDNRFCWRVPADTAGAGRVAAQTMHQVAVDPSRARVAGQEAQRFVARCATLAHSARRYLDVARELVRSRDGGFAAGRPPPRSAAAPRLALSALGCNDTAACTPGPRQAAIAMADAGIDVRMARTADDANESGRHHQVDLWFVTGDDPPPGLTDDNRAEPSGRRAIAWLHRDLPCAPDLAAASPPLVRELWVPSRFMADACRAAGPTPVVVMPWVVDVPLPPGPSSRREHGLPEGVCLFLASFDAGAPHAHQNLGGLVQAFDSAFGAAERRGPVRLVVHARGLADHPLRASLLDAMASVDAIVIEHDLPRHRVNSLIGCIDAYASLHRAHGFGLGIAEAMFHGKPVVATAHSGSMDFTTRTNSCLVGFTARSIDGSERGHHPEANGYARRRLWAEPNIEHARRWMRFLYENPDDRRRIGSAAAATVRERYGRAAVGLAVNRRLQELRAGA